MKVACPNCNSSQSFRQQQRLLEADRLEVFIRCTECQWEQVLYGGPAEVVRIELDLQKLRGKERAGAPVGGVIYARELSLADAKRRHGLSE